MKFFTSTLLILNLFFSSAIADVINKIEVKNNNRISEQSIITFGGIKLGSDYSETDLNRILSELYDTNFFSDIKFKVVDDTLIVTVKERKIIQKIILNGVKAEKTKNLILKNLNLKEKSPYEEFLAKQDVKKIKTSLYQSGYYFSEVEAVLKVNNNETVDIIYNLDLGKKALIKNIIFTGDRYYKDKKLRNIIVSEESKFWKFVTNKKFLNPDQIELDKRLLERFFLNKGFYKVEVENSSAVFNDSHFNLIYNINAGNIYSIGETELILPDDFDKNDFNDVEKILNNLKGKKYSLNKVNKVVKQIDKISVSRLYDFIDATIETEILNDNKLKLSFQVKESEKFYVNKINILGNNITEERVIRDMLEVDEGDPFNKLLHAKSLNNIRAKNIFKTVESEIVEGGEGNQKDIIISVEEKPTGEILLGAGVGSEGGTAAFSVSENNFLGKGVKLSTSLRVSEERLRGNFTIDNPNFNYSDKSLQTDIFITDTDKMNDFGYSSTDAGFSLGTGYEQYDNLFFRPFFRTTYETLETNNLASKNLKKQEGSYFTSLVGYKLDYDKRNQKFQTSDGFRSVFTQNIPLVSESNTLLNGYQIDSFHTISDITTSLGLYMRAVNGLSDDVRISERLNLPRKRLRGFEAGKIGPVDTKDYIGGNYSASLNFQTNLPMIMPSFQNIDFNYFIDAGNVWGVDYSNSIGDSNHIRSSTGFGVEWFSPIGPFTFTIAEPISKIDTDKTQSFQFNIGTTF
ncbi:outer membrane protein assembly factor BamA [Candidatus Pelagibacter communis]|uniref:outer membrane protein assembly factor BamA n=1 Tax=Pelagibacter ubique TaxID=198252 RepID=UPI00094D93C0|nr:outer membrane protein assembly factor BamA [Candidatus Pelagibacter ubique]